MKILITGANGQLGMCIRDISNHYPEYNTAKIFTIRF